MKTLRDLRIVFFGTPDFAVASLRAIVDAGVQVVAAVTAPDKPSGRGLQLTATPVKSAALALDIPVLQPEKLKAPDFISTLTALKADIHVVVAFRMLPEIVWAMPPMGTINVHGSLLPQYRGAAPINWAIINGESVTGVTTFRLKHQIDTGNMLLQQPVDITPADNAGTVHDKLMAAGADLLVRTLSALAEDSIRAQPQPEGSGLKHAPKIFKEDMRINWEQSVADINNFIRGLSPHPTAFTTLAEKTVKIFAAHDMQELTENSPGTADSDGKTYLRMAGTDGWIYLDEVQQEGKKRMPIIDFLRGFRL